MERLIPTFDTAPVHSFATEAAPAKQALVLSVAFGILVFWSAAAMMLDYLVGEKLRMFAGAARKQRKIR